MGGNVLELESDRLIQRGFEQGEEQQAVKTAQRMLEAGKYTAAEICMISGLSPEKVEQLKNRMVSFP